MSECLNSFAIEKRLARMMVPKYAHDPAVSVPRIAPENMKLKSLREQRHDGVTLWRFA
jgi:hypothetical protein